MSTASAQIGHSDSVMVKARGGSQKITFRGADSTYTDDKSSGRFRFEGSHLMFYDPSGKSHRKFRYQRRYIHFTDGGGDIQEHLKSMVPWRRSYSTHWWR